MTSIERCSCWERQPLGLPKAMPGEGCSNQLSTANVTGSWENECFIPHSWGAERKGLAVSP